MSSGSNLEHNNNDDGSTKRGKFGPSEDKQNMNKKVDGMKWAYQTAHICSNNVNGTNGCDNCATIIIYNNNIRWASKLSIQTTAHAYRFYVGKTQKKKQNENVNMV